MNQRHLQTVYENEEDRQTARILSTLIWVTWGAYLFVISANLYYEDWKAIAVTLAGGAVLIAPWILLRRGHLRVSSLFFVLSALFTVTVIATVGQGIRDLGIVAFPIVFIFAGLTLDRRLFRLCVGLALAAVCWLALGEVYGWFVTKPFDGEMANWLLLILVIILLLIAALAVDLLAINMQKSLEQARQEIARRKQAEEAVHLGEVRYRQAITAAGAVPYYRDYQKETHAYTFMGEGILQLTGYSADEVTPDIFDQQEQECIMRGSLAHLTPDEAGRMSEAGKIQQWTCDYRILTRDGQTRWVADSAIQIRDENNLRIGVIGILQDVTERKRAEERLRYQAKLLKNVSDAVVSTDNEFRITSWNQAAENLYGWRADEVIGRVFGEVVQTEYPAADRADIVAKFQKEGAWQGEVIQQSKDRQARYIFSSVTALLDHAGNPMGTVAVNRDVTARKQAEEALKNSRDALALAQEIANFGHWAWDPAANTVYWSDQFYRILGLAPHEVEPSAERYWQLIHPDDLARERKASQTALSTPGEIYDVEHRIIQPDGTERMVRSRGKVTHWSADGQPQYMIGTSHDITERKQAEESLKKSEELLHSIFVSTPDSITVVDLNGAVKLCNQSTADVHGYSSVEQLIGKSFIELIAEEDHQRAMEGMMRVIANGVVKDIPFTGLKGNGEKFTGELSVSVIKDSIGNVSGFVGITKDITERKQAEEQIQFLAKFPSENPHPVLRIAQNGDLLYINESGLRLLPEWNLQVGKPALPILCETALRALESETTQTLDLECKGRLYSFFVMPVTIAGYVNLYGSDITERKQAEEALREKEVQYRNLADSGTALIWRSGTDKLCNYFNMPWLKFTGRTLEQEMGNGWTEGVHPDDFDRCLEIYTTAFDKREAFEMDYRLRHVSGEYRWLQDLGTPNYNSAGEFVGYIGHCFDITARKRAEEQLLYKGTHDALTGIYNRAFFEVELARFERSREVPTSIIIADVDYLKVANDILGHAVGDQLIRNATNVLRSVFRESDVLARIGGDEFAVLLPSTDLASAGQMLARVQERLAKHNAEHPDQPPVQLSLGAATAEKNNLTEAFTIADRRMYADKAARKAQANHSSAS